MDKKCLLLPSALTLLLLSGCTSQTVSESQKDFFAMDTVMDFTIYGQEDLLDQTESMIRSLEAEMSVTDPDSEIAVINKNGYGKVTGDTSDLINAALSLCKRTDGALDISVYPIVRAWGFTTGNYQVPDDASIQSLLPLVDYTQIDYQQNSGDIHLPDGMEIDLGSVAKGYAGQKAADFLKENGVTSGLLSLGGNIQAIGSKPDGSPWKIGIQDPFQNESPMMVLSVTDKSVVTSGGYERYFQQDGKTYWHIMDPSTGYPAENGIVSVTIVGTDGMLCDGLSTSLFVMGLEKAADFWGSSDDFDAVFVTEDQTVYITEGLADSFALTKDYANTQVHVIRR